MSRIEELLERLVEQNDDIIQRLDAIVSEVNWTTDGASAKLILEALERIEANTSNS